MLSPPLEQHKSPDSTDLQFLFTDTVVSQDVKCIDTSQGTFRTFVRAAWALRMVPWLLCVLETAKTSMAIVQS